MRLKFLVIGMNKIIIFDTTLRDGEQAPGASLNIKEKLNIAKALSQFGVDVIEAGFPISSPGDFEAVKAVAKSIKGSSVCGLARAVKKDIDVAWGALKFARRGRIHVFLATSKIHMKYKLQKHEDEVLKLARDAVKYARNLCEDVEFSPEDASRTVPEFLLRVIESVINAGATTVNIPDTVGYAQPLEFGELISQICNKVPNINKAVISVHCHNDLGLAVANSLAAIKNGARQVECTINGIGERAGNAALEEIVMAIRTRGDFFKDVNVDIKTNQICKLSRLVSNLTSFLVAPNKAIVGSNAFRHEAGIHQDGILKKRSTYEIMSAQDVGFNKTELVLGKHSGRHAFSQRLKELGFHLKSKEIEEAFSEFKRLSDKKKQIFDEDLLALIRERFHKESKPIWQLRDFRIISGTALSPQAEITLRHKGKKFKADAYGDGPIDACFKAIDKITGIKIKLLDYRLESLTSGKDAQGSANLRFSAQGKEFTGRGSSTDIIEASIRAYLSAINRVASI